MTQLKIAIVTLLFLAPLLAGCDWSARWDLRQAEKALKEADHWNAEHFAEREYRKAQAALIEGMDLARIREINFARDKAAEAKMWAEEAAALAKYRYEELQKEKDALGVYKP